MQRRQKLFHSSLPTDMYMYRMSVSWFSVKSATYGGYCIPRESWLYQRSRDVSYSCGATHFMNLIFRIDLHMFMSFSITAMIQLSHSTMQMQQGSIPSVSTVLVRCRLWIPLKIVPCVAAAKTKSLLSEDRLRHAKWPSSRGSDPHFDQSTSILLLKIWISTNGVTSILEFLIPHTLH